MISWAPHETGCLLACASSDGHVSVLEFRDNSWTHQIFHAHGMGVNSISWAPAAAPGSIVSSNPGPGQQRRFVTGGSDNLLKIWNYKYVLPTTRACLSVSDEIANTVFLTLAQTQRPTVPPRPWKGILIGFVTLLGRLASSLSRTSRLHHRTRLFEFGLRICQTLLSGRARCSNSITLCGG